MFGKGETVLIYADNAATTKMSEAAINTMVSLIGDTYGNPSSLYEFGQKAKEVLEQAREDVAEAIGASPRRSSSLPAVPRPITRQ